jgi:hypothetical protein
MRSERAFATPEMGGRVFVDIQFNCIHARRKDGRSALQGAFASHNSSGRLRAPVGIQSSPLSFGSPASIQPVLDLETGNFVKIHAIARQQQGVVSEANGSNFEIHRADPKTFALKRFKS